MWKLLKPLTLLLAAIWIVGWANLHTDEPTVVLAFALPAIVALTFALRGPSILWGLAVGASVPASQILALTFGWRTPYANSISAVRESCVAILFTVVAALLAGMARRYIVLGHPTTSSGPTR